MFAAKSKDHWERKPSGAFGVFLAETFAWIRPLPTFERLKLAESVHSQVIE